MFREADRKMAGIQYSLEDRASLERKYKKQVNNCDNEASVIRMIELILVTTGTSGGGVLYFKPVYFLVG